MYDEIASNKRKSAFLIVAFCVVVIAVGFAFSYTLNLGSIGVIAAVVFAVGSAWISYYKSDAVALRMSRAYPADPQQYARLHNLVEGIAIAAGIPKPRIFIVDDTAPNAFATGRNPEHAAIAVTTGLLERMNRVELEGVIAHELSHVKNYDILISTIAVTLVGIIALLSDWGVRSLAFGGGRRDNGGGQLALVFALVSVLLLVISPLIAMLMQAAVSRRREAYADVQAVNLTRYPPGLISALEKLRENRTVVHTASRATAHLWIESPLARTKEEGSLSKLNHLFDTHPPLDERIAALQAL